MGSGVCSPRTKTWKLSLPSGSTRSTYSRLMMHERWVRTNCGDGSRSSHSLIGCSRIHLRPSAAYASEYDPAATMYSIARNSAPAPQGFSEGEELDAEPGQLRPQPMRPTNPLHQTVESGRRRTPSRRPSSLHSSARAKDNRPQ